MKKQEKKTSNKKKYILIGVGAVALGVGGYFLYKHLQKKNDQSDIDAFKDAIADGDYSSITQSSSAPAPKPAPSSGGSKPVTVYNQFPLKYGSKGTTVRDLQTALNKKYGTKIDVDGDWRNQTENALKSKGLPTVLDSETYAKIILGTYKKGGSSSKPSSSSSGSGTKPTVEVNSPTIAKKLHTAIDKDDIFSALAALKLIKDTAKYKKVNAEFTKTKMWTLTHGYVSHSVVTALQEQFDSEEYKKKINNELFRIGLKYNGSQWSLSGFQVLQKIATIRPTMVWDASGRRIKVPSETILGNFLAAKNGVTKFVTLDNRYLFVNTTEIKYSHD
jgi:hypothetical protein